MDLEEAPGAPALRRKVLVIVDETPECMAAVDYATLLVRRSGCILVMLRVLCAPSLGYGRAVEARMRDEARDEAEKAMAGFASRAHDRSGQMVEFIIREGDRIGETLGLIHEDRDIRMVVLASASDGEPGPLVSSVVARVPQIRVPLVIVPGSMDRGEMEGLL